MFVERGLEVVVPEKPGLDYVHEKYGGEFVEGRFLDSTREGLVQVMERLRARGADGVILGGTELPLVLRDVPFALSLHDTTRIHVDAALNAAAA